jgi:hypothetical protein
VTESVSIPRQRVSVLPFVVHLHRVHGPDRREQRTARAVLSSAKGKRQVVLAMNEEPHSLPKRANSLFMQLLVGAYCGSSHS